MTEREVPLAVELTAKPTPSPPRGGPRFMECVTALVDLVVNGDPLIDPNALVRELDTDSLADRPLAREMLAEAVSIAASLALEIDREDPWPTLQVLALAVAMRAEQRV